VIDKDGKPLRIDRAYSWESPLAAHGMMHMVITNAVNRDPYPIDTLLLFMANMAWNSTMNTGEVRRCSSGKTRAGSTQFRSSSSSMHSTPRRSFSPISCCRTRRISSGTTHLAPRPADLRARCGRRWDPRAGGRPRSRRQAWQEVLVDCLEAQFPAFTRADGSRKYKDYKDFVVNYEKGAGHRSALRLARRGRR